jgi:hypothetical protein
MSLHNVGQMGAIGEIMALFGRDPLLSDPLYSRVKPRRPRGALLLIGALALVFIGQVLFLLDLTF